MTTLGEILDDIVGIEEENAARRTRLQQRQQQRGGGDDVFSPSNSGASAQGLAESAAAAANDVVDSVHNAADTKAKVDLVCDLFESSSGAFDAMLYLQAVHFLEKHEIEHKVATRLLRDAEVSDDEWHSLTGKEKVTLVFEEPLRTSIGKFLLGLQGVLVFVTIIGVIMESMPWWNPEVDPTQADAWLVLDGIISTYFLVELVVRLVCFPPPRRRFVFSAVTILDFISVLPIFFELVASKDYRTQIGMLKALRLIRLTKLVRHVPTFQNLWMALRKSLPALIAPSIFLLIVSLLLSAGVYYAERGSYNRRLEMFLNTNTLCAASSGAELDKFECQKDESKFYSILHTSWFVITTMTSVGYGDMFPKKPMGMFLSVLAMVVGSLFLAMPIAIIGSYYTIIVDENKRVSSNLATRLMSTGSDIDLANDSMATSGGLPTPRDSDAPGRQQRRKSTALFESALDMRAISQADQQHLQHKRAKQRETLSPAEKLVSFLRVNVKSSLVKQLDLEEPSASVAFFANLFLMDFVQEFAKMPVGGVSFKQTVGELRPTWIGASSNPPHRLLKVKDSTFPVKLFHQHQFKGKPPELMAELLEKEMSGRITATERLQLSMAKDQGSTTRQVTLMTSNVLGNVGVRVGGGDPAVQQASGMDIHITPDHHVWAGSGNNASSAAAGRGGGAGNLSAGAGASYTGLHQNEVSSFVSFSDALSAKVETRDGDSYLFRKRTKISNDQTQLSLSGGRIFHVDILRSAHLNFSAQRQVYPENIVEFPLHGLAASSRVKLPDIYERIHPTSRVNDGEGGEIPQDEFGNDILVGSGGIDGRRQQTLQFVYQDNVEDIRRAVLAFKCALVIQRREAATMSAAAISRISGGGIDDGGYNPSQATLLKEEIELLEMCELKSALVRKQREQLGREGRKQYKSIPGYDDDDDDDDSHHNHHSDDDDYYNDKREGSDDDDDEQVGGYFGEAGRDAAVLQVPQQQQQQQLGGGGVLSRHTNLFGSKQQWGGRRQKRYQPNITL